MTVTGATLALMGVVLVVWSAVEILLTAIQLYGEQH